MNTSSLINRNTPLIMHIDLNSCFATVEQQANPLLRGRPVVVAAYATPNAFILAPSVEAKQCGIKMGMSVRDAQAIYPDVIVRAPDPPKYRDVHTRFKAIFESYTPNVYPKSIDEAVLDFTPLASQKPDLVAIAKEIKLRMRQEIGEWIRCSVGVGTNMFLAKLAATLHKPDGLTVVDHTNLLDTYASCELLDFCGINVRYKARLNAHGILTPLDFFYATTETLEKDVFRSVIGRRWFEKLRGFEADQNEFPTKSIGHQYALHHPTDDQEELSRLLMKLCEKMGRRLRRKELLARGIHLAFRYKDYTYWHHSKLMEKEMYTTVDLYQHAKLILAMQPEKKRVSLMSVTSYHLSPYSILQLQLFEEEYSKARRVADAADKMNDVYGEFTVVPGLMMDMRDTIIDRIAFGGVRDIEQMM